MSERPSRVPDTNASTLPAAALLAAILWSGADANAQNLLLTIDGSNPGDAFGTSVSPAGDVDGDGFADFLVGIPQDDAKGTDAGAGVVVSGHDGSILFALGGIVAGDHLGRACLALGDVNGDGVGDYALGAPGPAVTPPTSIYKGRVRAYSGATGGQLFLMNGIVVRGRLGAALAQVGDLNNDGVPDLLVGAPGSARQGAGSGVSGNAYLVSGKSGQFLRNHAGASKSVPAASGPNVVVYDEFGTTVAGLGDVDQDGIPDYAVGFPGDVVGGALPGGVRVFSGANGMQLFSYLSGESGDGFGGAMVAVGDLDGDGRTDLVVGAPHAAGAAGADCGRVVGFSPALGAILWSLESSNAGARFGARLATGADADGDGFADVLAARGDGGAVSLVSGVSGAPLAAFAPQGTAAGFGAALAFVDDTDGDGLGDAVIGAPDGDAGSLFVFSREPGNIQDPCGALSIYGQGCSGAGGHVPQFSVSGCAAPGGTVHLEVTHGLGGSFTLMFFGMQPASIPMWGGCTLLFAPILPFIVIAPLHGFGPGNGHAEVDLGVPPLPYSATVYGQAFLFDPFVSHGFSNTNGIVVELP